MSKVTDAELSAALRPVAEALVRPDDVRRQREHDQSHDRGGNVRAEKVRGRLRQNSTGVINAASVQVPPLPISASLSLSAQLVDLAAAIAVAALTGGGEWSVLTTGDVLAPELVFSDGDVISTHES